MTILFLTLPLMALVFMWGFRDAGWCKAVRPHEYLPYSLGALVLYAYAVLCTYPPTDSAFFSYLSLSILVTLWLVGFLYDYYGERIDQLSGRVRIFYRVSRLLIMILIAAALIYSWFGFNEAGFLQMALVFMLLICLPHAVAQIDTGPLRLWKVSIFVMIAVFASLPVPAFVEVLYAVTVFYLIFVLEGEHQAVLGMSGSFTIGGLIALWIVHALSLFEQFLAGMLLILAVVIGKHIFSTKAVMKTSFLRFVDHVGIRKT
ncbi:hypothetical protein NSQ26_07360 [Bacillus sp. FSL W7-1360]